MGVRAWDARQARHRVPAGLRLRFNLSHAGFVACALTLDDEIGVDLEDTAREIDLPGLAQRVFSPEESLALRALAPESRRRRFFEIWTLKEAYLKARGLGFALAPRSAKFDLGERHRVRLQFTPEAGDHPAAWCFALLSPQPGHVLALAARNGGGTVDVRTFLAAPGVAQARQVEPRLYASGPMRRNSSSAGGREGAGR